MINTSLRLVCRWTAARVGRVLAADARGFGADWLAWRSRREARPEARAS
jgi:hypothetical protein